LLVAGVALMLASIVLPYVAPAAAARLGAGGVYGMRIAGVVLAVVGWLAGRNQPKGPKAKIREPL
jgi:hypothetical protein